MKSSIVIFCILISLICSSSNAQVKHSFKDRGKTWLTYDDANSTFRVYFTKKKAKADSYSNERDEDDKYVYVNKKRRKKRKYRKGKTIVINTVDSTNEVDSIDADLLEFLNNRNKKKQQPIAAINTNTAVTLQIRYAIRTVVSYNVIQIYESDQIPKFTLDSGTPIYHYNGDMIGRMVGRYLVQSTNLYDLKPETKRFLDNPVEVNKFMKLKLGGYFIASIIPI